MVDMTRVRRLAKVAEQYFEGDDEEFVVNFTKDVEAVVTEAVAAETVRCINAICEYCRDGHEPRLVRWESGWRWIHVEDSDDPNAVAGWNCVADHIRRN